MRDKRYRPAALLGVAAVGLGSAAVLNAAAPPASRRKRSRMRTAVVVVGLAAALLALAGPGATSLNVAENVRRPALRVDGRGWAEVSWTSAGARRYLLIPPTGRVLPGRRLTRPDVSRPTNAVAIPFGKALRRTPDGRYRALQLWRVHPADAVELRFSRWPGQPTELVLEAVEPQAGGYVVSGRATFHAKPVPQWSLTPEGKRIRTYAYIDRATATGWRRIGGVAVRADGSFARFVPGSRLPRFRAVLPAPNISSATWAPDALSQPLAPAQVLP